MPDAAAINRDLEAEAPAIHASLSALGRRAFFPPGIPHQAMQARGTRYNGTIGQITDGGGLALPLPSMRATVALEGDSANRAFLYSPVPGIPEVREAWRTRQRRDCAESVPSSLPLVVNGLTHALSIAADLFTEEGRTLAVPTPYWGNYRQVFTMRTGARVATAPSLDANGRFDPHAIPNALADLPAGQPATAIVNMPSNPGGYMPTAAERAALVQALVGVARERPLVVLCDDAYAGLVYEDVPRASLFWDLIGAHPQLIPVKIDGSTKELSFFGGRVGFLTFGVDPASKTAAALESKVKSLVRATVGSPVATSQIIVLEALRSPDLDDQIEAVRLQLDGRYRVLKDVLARQPDDLLRPLPFNAGCFAVLRLPSGVDAEKLRHHLIAEHQTGLIAIPPHHVRIAFCSVAKTDLPELVGRLVKGVRELMG